MRALPFTIRRRVEDYLSPWLSPRLLPGKHRFCATLDTPRESCITDMARFDAMAKRMFPEIGAK